MAENRLVRVVGFILRAILAASDGAKENGGIVIAETIFFSFGFVGLLYAVFILILNRSIPSSLYPKAGTDPFYAERLRLGNYSAKMNANHSAGYWTSS